MANRKRIAAEISRKRILEAAARRFGEGGLEATRLEDIGADVGLGRTGVLYHFESKERLYDAVVQELAGGLLQVMRGSLAGEASMQEKVERGVSDIVDYLVANPPMAQLVLRAAVSTDPDVRKRAHVATGPILAHALEVVALARAAGMALDVSQLLLLASFIVGPVAYYLAAIPTFAGPLAEDHLAPDRIDALKRQVLATTRQIIGARRR